MGFEESYVPENEAEMELMEDLHHVTRRAHRHGLSKADIARLLAFMASATLQPEAGEESVESPESRSLRQEMRGKAREPKECPECASDIAGVESELGGKLMVRPCGHEFDWEDREQLGDWADELDPEVDDE